MNNPNFFNEADVVSRCRAINKFGEYAILPRENRCFSMLPDWKLTTADVLTSPDRGAKFVQMELVIQPNGGTETPINETLQQFLFVLSGEVNINMNTESHILTERQYIWLPPGEAYTINNEKANDCRLVWIRKPYKKLLSYDVPEMIIGDESEIPLTTIETHQERHLLPEDDIRFDICMKTIYFEPGAYFTFVESHVQEHGIIMLEGSGIYYVNDHYHEVYEGDFIYMAPWCLQFMYATGWKRSGYLLYKDWNRDSIEGFKR